MTVYTAIFSNYDELKTPFIITPGWKYIVFTDQDLLSDVWEVYKVPLIKQNPQKTARYYKIMFHEHIRDRFSLWVDATFFINCDLNKWWEQFKMPFTTVRHPFDNCVYKEFESCMRGKKSDPLILSDQRRHYKKKGMPENNGLIASGILMREKTPDVIEFCKLWWEQVSRWSPRDQIAFAYVDYRLPDRHISIDWDYTYMKEFIHIPHLHKAWREGKLNETLKTYGNVQGN